MKYHTLLLAVALALTAPLVQSGDLDPPSAPASTSVDLATINERAAAARSNASAAATRAAAASAAAELAQDPRTPITEIPFDIDAPGSYVLTGDLESSIGGISILADDVTLDLNGFSLINPTGSPVSGIVGGTVNGVTIRNGTVRGWGSAGIILNSATGVALRDVAVAMNGGTGVLTGDGALLEGCRAVGNGGIGFNLGAACVLIECVGEENGSTGFFVGPGCVLSSCAAGGTGAGPGYESQFGSIFEGCIARGNSAFGFETSSATVLRDCVGSENGSSGFSTSDGNVVTGCVARGNGGVGIDVDSRALVRDCSAFSNSSDGIHGSSGSLLSGCSSGDNARSGFNVVASFIHGCVSRGNGTGGDGAGFEMGSSSRIEDNLSQDNPVGYRTPPSMSVVYRDCLVVRNASVGDTTGFMVDDAVNLVGVEITGHGSLTSTNAWANFTH